MRLPFAIACWLACVAAVAVAIPALAGSKRSSPGRPHDYVGKIDGEKGSRVSFQVIEKPNGNLGVKRFTVKDAPTKCGGSNDTTSYGLPGYFSLRVEENGRFHVKDSPSGFRDESLFVVRGKLQGGGEANGWLRVIDDFDFMPICDTRRLDWTAHK